MKKYDAFRPFSEYNADVVCDGVIKLTDLATLKQYSCGDNVKLGPQ